MRAEVVTPSVWHEDIPATLEVTEPASQGSRGQPGIACGTALMGWILPSQSRSDTDLFHQYHVEVFKLPRIGSRSQDSPLCSSPHVSAKVQQSSC